MKLIAKPFKLNFKNEDTIALFIKKETNMKIDKFIPNELQFIYKKADISFFKGNSNEVLFIPFADHPSIILCGIGEKDKLDSEVLRNACSNIINQCRDKSILSVHIVMPEIKAVSCNLTFQAIAEGAYLSNYSFVKYKSKDPDNDKPLVEKAYFYTSLKNASKLLKDTEIVSNNTLLCRDLVNDTSENSNPVKIAAIAKSMSKFKNVSCTVFGKNELTKMKMGLLLAVSKGSTVPPQLVVLKYNGDPDSKKYFAIIGKGITFDSGGMNLKPSGSIETMRMDMSGAAAALYAFKSISELNLKKNVYAVVPLAENMLSNNAYRPGDIITSYSGKTVEIGNTDAEGRLILADALAYTEKKLKPKFIVDLATLTGACVAAFGELVAAYLTTNSELGDMLEDSSELTGDKIWKLPLYPEYEENMKSELADINNMSSDRNAGTIMGTVFLKNFVENTKWAHIDIAGTAWYSKARGYRTKYATGFGVRLLTEVVREWSD